MNLDHLVAVPNNADGCYSFNSLLGHELTKEWVGRLGLGRGEDLGLEVGKLGS